MHQDLFCKDLTWHPALAELPATTEGYAEGSALFVTSGRCANTGWVSSKGSWIMFSVRSYDEPVITSDDIDDMCGMEAALFDSDLGYYAGLYPIGDEEDWSKPLSKTQERQLVLETLLSLFRTGIPSVNFLKAKDGKTGVLQSRCSEPAKPAKPQKYRLSSR